MTGGRRATGFQQDTPLWLAELKAETDASIEHRAVENVLARKTSCFPRIPAALRAVAGLPKNQSGCRAKQCHQANACQRQSYYFSTEVRRTHGLSFLAFVNDAPNHAKVVVLHLSTYQSRKWTDEARSGKFRLGRPTVSTAKWRPSTGFVDEGVLGPGVAPNRRRWIRDRINKSTRRPVWRAR
jgi:hypothetical protein